MHDRPEPVLFRRFHHFCYERGFDWEAAVLRTLDG
jgi:hypothetical protein